LLFGRIHKKAPNLPAGRQEIRGSIKYFIKKRF